MPNKKYSIGKATTAYKSLVIAPADSRVVIHWMWIVNTGSASATLYIAHTPAWQSKADSQHIVDGLTMSAGTMISQEAIIYLEPGDHIVVKSDTASAFVVTLYGSEGYK